MTRLIGFTLLLCLMSLAILGADAPSTASRTVHPRREKYRFSASRTAFSSSIRRTLGDPAGFGSEGEIGGNEDICCRRRDEPQNDPGLTRLHFLSRHRRRETGVPFVKRRSKINRGKARGGRITLQVPAQSGSRN